MSSSRSLAPITSLTIPRALAEKNPAHLLARLIPEKIVTLSNCTIYFLRRTTGDSKELGRGRIARDCAMLSMDRGAGTFTLSYYPINGEIQVVKRLEIDQLGAAVADLVTAGFPHVKETAPRATPHSHSHSHPVVAEHTMHGTPKPALLNGAS